MVVTPDHRAFDSSTPLSPLLLPSRSPGLHPTQSHTTGSSSASLASSSQSVGHPLMRKSSTGSFSKLSEFRLDDDPNGDATPESATPRIAEVPHVALSVDAGEWRHPVFKTKVMSILRRLRVPLWNHPSLTPSSIHLQKVSGALTNAVFFVSFNPLPTPTSPSMSPLLTPTMPPTDPDHPPPLTSDQFPPTLLLRIYGPSCDALISRSEELRILHVLSTCYGLGPSLYGTFTNGRVEQFFPSRALSPNEIRTPKVARGIARRMRELHSADLRLLGFQDGREGEPVVWRRLNEWARQGEEVLNALTSLGGRWELWVEEFSLHKLREEIDSYHRWVDACTDKGKGLVFSHNDTQYGNLLLLDSDVPKELPDHYKYIVIDFEYAAPNPRGYDIANHFHEWRADYHHPTLSWSLTTHLSYPSLLQREDWYRAYLSVEMAAGEEVVGRRRDVPQEKVDKLEREVRIWSPACSAMWALWGIVQGEEQVRHMVEGTEGYQPDFDCLAYSMERLQMFRKEARELGVPL